MNNKMCKKLILLLSEDVLFKIIMKRIFNDNFWLSLYFKKLR